MKNKGTIYISGQMSGLPDWGKANFDAKAKELRSEGWRVLNPSDANWDGITVGGENNGTPCVPQWMVRPLIMKRDFEMLRQCDTMYLMKDWMNSGGATDEVGFALMMGIDLIHEVEPEDGSTVEEFEKRMEANRIKQENHYKGSE